MKKEKIFFIIILISGIIFFLLDRLLKYQAIKNNIFQANFGIAFSIALPPGIILFFYIIILMAILGLLIKKILVKNFWEIKNSGLILIGMGAISNLIDRLAYGYVVDYLNFYFWYNNLADIMICLGVVMMIFFVKRKPWLIICIPLFFFELSPICGKMNLL